VLSFQLPVVALSARELLKNLVEKYAEFFISESE